MGGSKKRTRGFDQRNARHHPSLSVRNDRADGADDDDDDDDRW